MKKYYVGYIVKQTKIENNIDLGQSDYAGYFNSNFKKLLKNLSNSDISCISNYINEHREIIASRPLLIEDYNIIKWFNSLDFDLNLKYKSNYGDVTRIIYSVEYDEKGNVFAKEYKTGLLFPLYTTSSFNRNYYITSYISRFNVVYNFKIQDSIKNDCFHKVGSIVLFESKASMNDIRNYNINKTSISNLYGENSFAEEVILKEDEDVKQTEEMKTIVAIKGAMHYVEQIDTEKYKQLNDEYMFLLKNYENEEANAIIDIKNLSNFYDKVNYALYFRKVEESYTYLDIVYNQILDKINGKGTATQSLNDIDYLYELFLKYGKDLPLIEQDSILMKFSDLYVAKIKEEPLSSEEIMESHFTDFINYVAFIKSYSGENVDELVKIIRSEDSEQLLKLGD